MPVKSYLERKTADKSLTVMDWPPQSPDLNTGVYEYVSMQYGNIQYGITWTEKEIKDSQPQSKEELWEVLKEA